MDVNINRLSQIVILCGLSASCNTGCMQPEVQPNATANAHAAQPPGPSVNRAADNYEWVKRLQATKPVDGIQQIAAGGNRRSFPVPVPRQQGSGYQLIVDQGMGLAWLQGVDGMNGPWSLDQPDVMHLLKSVANLPTNPVAQQ